MQSRNRGETGHRQRFAEVDICKPPGVSASLIQDAKWESRLEYNLRQWICHEFKSRD
jgi:hypothetical protein